MTITYELAGTGPTVVLVHAGVCDRRMWDPQWDDLVNAGYRVIRVDLYGFGDTPVPVAPYNNADAIVEVLKEVGAAEAALVASSFGGKVAQEVAARFPAMVSSLLLLCAAGDLAEESPQMEEFDTRENALLEAGDVAGAVELNVTQWLGPEADDAAAQQVRQMQRHAFEVQLAAEDVEGIEYDFGIETITAPTLAVWGAHDLPDFRDIAANIAAVVPGARQLELDWAGHLPSMERPAEITALILEHLDKTVPRS